VAPVSSLAAAEERLGAGRIAEACALGQVAVEAQPRSAAAWQFVGRCRMRLGERDRASAAFRRYLELAPGASDAPFVRAILEEGP
jgi:cytochrome c-type biogenesis protein CcmH/NrfG